MKQVAIIVAGGKGNRMNASVPKQFLILNNQPILMHTIRCFIQYNSKIEIIVVLPNTEIKTWTKLCRKYNFNIKHKVVAGGKERFFSVKNGLQEINGNGIVFIHDGVRPLVSSETIKRCYNEAEMQGNAIPALPITESIRKVENRNNKMVNRDNYVAIQTPQTFDISLIKTAYNQEYKTAFTDDASVLENIGENIKLVKGNRENIKITYESDLKVAEILIEKDNTK